MPGRFNLEAIFTAKDGTKGVVAKIGSRIDRMTRAAGRGLQTLDRHVGTVHNSLKMIGGGMLLAGGAIGLVGKNVIDAGADFEQAITAVGAVSLMSRDQIADLEKKALELGATTTFSATEVANAMELMGKAGFTNAEILEGVGGVLAAAAADGGELADTASHVSNVLKGMGLAASQTGRVADVLTLASSRTNSSIGSLGESMKQLAPVASQFKIPLEQAVGMVALLQDVGLDASSAGTSLASSLTKLAKPSKKARASMAELGISFQDAKGNMLPVNEVFGQLAKAASKSGGNMKAAAFFAELVGLESQKAAINLAKMFSEGKAQTLFTELEKAEGSAEKMAKLKLDNLRGDMEQLGGAVDTLKINLFNTQSGPLRGVVQETTKWVEANQGLIQTKVGEFLQGVKDNLPEIVTWIKRIATAVAIFYAIATAVKVAQVALAAYELTVGAVALAKKGLAFASTLSVAGIRASGAAATAAAAPMLALAAAVGVAIAAVALLLDQLGKLDKETEGLGFMGIIGEMIEQGTIDPFKAVDEHHNREARKRFNTEQAGRVNTEAPDAAKANALVAQLLNDPFDGLRPMQNQSRAEFGGGRSEAGPQVVTPQERTAKTVKETITTSQSEVTIRDETGKAEITKQPKAGPKIKLQSTGAF